MTRVPLDCGRTITTLSTSRERMFYYHKKKPGNPGRGNRASRRTLARDRTWKDRARSAVPFKPRETPVAITTAKKGTVT